MIDESVPAEYLAARRAAVMFAPAAQRSLAVAGREAEAFLRAHLSADVAPLRPGGGLRAALLAPKGQLLCIVRVLRRPGAFLLDAPLVGWPELVQALRRGRIGWDVDLRENAGDRVLVSVVGPTAGEHCALPAGARTGDHRLVRFGGRAAIAVRTELGADVIARAGARHAVVADLHARGIATAHAGLWDVLRVEAAIPEFGRDIGTATLPLEAHLVPDVVQLEGRVFPGLQTSLRQFHRGTVQRCLRQLQPAAPVCVGDAVTDADGQPLGRVTSSIVSPSLGPLALATLRTTAQPGDWVWINETAARITAS